jgi:xanthine dehydrogenase accessory factor
MKQTDFTRLTDELAAKGEPFAVATVVKTEGSSLGKPGFKVVISGDGEVLYGTLGGACPESAIVHTAKKVLSTGTPRVVKVYLESVERAVEAVVKSQNEDEIHVETNCGGTMEIYVEPYLPALRLVLVGQGGKDEVEDALVRLGKLLDFEVVVVDHSPELTQEPDKLIRDLDFDLSRFEFHQSDSVVVLTKGERDADTLLAASRNPVRYVGMMASRQRAADTIGELRKRGIPEACLEPIHTPAGADIGALTPAEIALSIMAEVVAAKYGKRVASKSLRAEGQVSAG